LDETETLSRLGLALAIGFLIGVERGWREREEGEGERAAGLRTFALIGLLGGVWGFLSMELGPAPMGLGFLAFAAAFVLFRWRETEHEKSFGMTTVVAGFLTFSLGTLAVLGDMVAAAAAGVATAALLAAKEWLHGWLRILTWPEIRATLILLAMSFVALPVLPDEGYGPYEAINPRTIWLMTIVIAGVSFAGYVAVKIAGEKYGTLIAGIAGGVVSSTATTLAMARRAKLSPPAWRSPLGGALAASATMFVRVAIIVAIFGANLLPLVLGPLGAAFVVTIVAALFLNPPWARSTLREKVDEAAYTNPFELRAVLAFAALLVVVIIATRALTDALGDRGLIVLAAIAGVPDVDAVTLSMTELSGPADREIAAAILVAVAANSLSKSAIALAVGGTRFGVAYLAASLSAIVVGAVVAAIMLTTAG
jgi:uncharacterized membrane protein (DUF4010 family)